MPDPLAVPAPTPPPKVLAFQAAWPAIMCVVGLDYLSTLGYVPSIAYDAAGPLAPLTMAGLGVITVLGALPVYLYLAGRSPNGQGALALLERLIPGWHGKLLILVLLGFAATDLIFTRTFSAADAAVHALHCPEASWQEALDHLSNHWEQGRPGMPRFVRNLTATWSHRQLVVTMLLLGIGLTVSIVFRKGFKKRFVQIAVATAAIYFTLNALLVCFGIAFLLERPELIEAWWQQVPHAEREVYGAASALSYFPKVALGLSGFEMTMLLMPLVRGRPDDDPDRPRGRIRNTRKLLAVSALLMSIALLAATFVTTVLIPAQALRTDGLAQNRALAYLAHGGMLAGLPAGERIAPFAGLTFGVIYDLSTIAILCLAGVSVSLCLVEYVPPYLHRLGMEFEWVRKIGALIYVFTALKVLITFYYHANVDQQRSAYTASVLVIFSASTFAVCLDIWKRRDARGYLLRIPIWFGAVLLVFLLSTADTIWTQPGGAALSLWFILFVLVSSILTRFYRSTELRFKGFEFADEATRQDYEKLKTADFPILVPHRPGQQTIEEKEVEIRARHRLGNEVPLVFIIAELGDASDFFLRPRLSISRENGRVIIHVRHCASLAHVLTAIAIDMSRFGVAPEIHFGWSAENPITANLNFVLFGHGNVPWMVYTLLRQSDLPDSQRPRVVVG